MAPGTDAPLRGVKVIDLSRLFPGPYATLLLADLGADVVRVEDARGGDMVRFLPPHAADGQGATFHALNRGKRSVALPLQREEGKEALRQLLRGADVLVESFRPGVLERMGFAPDALLADNPRLIVCRISGYGQDGPDRLRAGHDINYAARAGVLGMMQAPAVLPVQVADLVGGSWPAALQVVSALYAREHTGKGAVIDVSMTEGAHAMLVMPLARYAAAPDEPIGQGRDLLAGALPSYRVYPTKDGHLAVGALEPKFWLGFTSALGLEDLADKGLSTGDEGRAAQERIAAKLRERTSAEWEAFFRDHDVCVEPVRAPEDAATIDEQLRARGVTVDVTVGNDALPLPRTPLRLSQAATGPAPSLGEHTREVLLGWGVEPDVVRRVTSGES